MKRIYIAAVSVCALSWTTCGRAIQFSAPNGSEVAFKNRTSNVEKTTSNVQVEGEGVVIRLLADDLNGDRHQRFVLRLPSGQTVLIVHNIDIAPRVVGLQKDDSVRFYGEYVRNEEGGMVHWTHHDPKGRHTAGWLKHGGRIYQ